MIKFLTCQIVYLNFDLNFDYFDYFDYHTFENYLPNLMKYVAVLISYPLYDQNFSLKENFNQSKNMVTFHCHMIGNCTVKDHFHCIAQ